MTSRNNGRRLLPGERQRKKSHEYADAGHAMAWFVNQTGSSSRGGGSPILVTEMLPSRRSRNETFFKKAPRWKPRDR